MRTLYKTTFLFFTLFTLLLSNSFAENKDDDLFTQSFLLAKVKEIQELIKNLESESWKRRYCLPCADQSKVHDFPGDTKPVKEVAQEELLEDFIDSLSENLKKTAIDFVHMDEDYSVAKKEAFYHKRYLQQMRAKLIKKAKKINSYINVLLQLKDKVAGTEIVYYVKKALEEAFAEINKEKYKRREEASDRSYKKGLLTSDFFKSSSGKNRSNSKEYTIDNFISDLLNDKKMRRRKGDLLSHYFSHNPQSNLPKKELNQFIDHFIGFRKFKIYVDKLVFNGMTNLPSFLDWIEIYMYGKFDPAKKTLTYKNWVLNNIDRSLYKKMKADTVAMLKSLNDILKAPIYKKLRASMAIYKDYFHNDFPKFLGFISKTIDKNGRNFHAMKRGYIDEKWMISIEDLKKKYRRTLIDKGFYTVLREMKKEWLGSKGHLEKEFAKFIAPYDYKLKKIISKALIDQIDEKYVPDISRDDFFQLLKSNKDSLKKFLNNPKAVAWYIKQGRLNSEEKKFFIKRFFDFAYTIKDRGDYSYSFSLLKLLDPKQLTANEIKLISNIFSHKHKNIFAEAHYTFGKYRDAVFHSFATLSDFDKKKAEKMSIDEIQDLVFARKWVDWMTSAIKGLPSRKVKLQYDLAYYLAPFRFKKEKPQLIWDDIDGNVSRAIQNRYELKRILESASVVLEEYDRRQDSIFIDRIVPNLTKKMAQKMKEIKGRELTDKEKDSTKKLVTYFIRSNLPKSMFDHGLELVGKLKKIDEMSKHDYRGNPDLMLEDMAEICRIIGPQAENYRSIILLIKGLLTSKTPAKDILKSLLLNEDEAKLFIKLIKKKKLDQHDYDEIIKVLVKDPNFPASSLRTLIDMFWPKSDKAVIGPMQEIPYVREFVLGVLGYRIVERNEGRVKRLDSYLREKFALMGRELERRQMKEKLYGELDEEISFGLISKDEIDSTIEKAEKSLAGIRTLSVEDRVAIVKAHLVGSNEIGKDGKTKARVGNYTVGQLLRKWRVLKKAGFEFSQFRKLAVDKVIGFSGVNTPDIVGYVNRDYQKVKDLLEKKIIEAEKLKDADLRRKLEKKYKRILRKCEEEMKKLEELDNSGDSKLRDEAIATYYMLEDYHFEVRDYYFFNERPQGGFKVGVKDKHFYNENTRIHNKVMNALNSKKISPHFEGEVALRLIKESDFLGFYPEKFVDFQQKFKVNGSKFETDLEFKGCIVEVTLREGPYADQIEKEASKYTQLNRYFSGHHAYDTLNPNNKPVILYGPNYVGADYKGSEIARLKSLGVHVFTLKDQGLDNTKAGREELFRRFKAKVESFNSANRK